MVYLLYCYFIVGFRGGCFVVVLLGFCFILWMNVILMLIVTFVCCLQLCLPTEVNLLALRVVCYFTLLWFAVFGLCFN